MHVINKMTVFLCGSVPCVVNAGVNDCDCGSSGSVPFSILKLKVVKKIGEYIALLGELQEV